MPCIEVQVLVGLVLDLLYQHLLMVQSRDLPEGGEAVLVVRAATLVLMDFHHVLVLHGVAVHHYRRQNGLSVN